MVKAEWSLAAARAQQAEWSLAAAGTLAASGERSMVAGGSKGTAGGVVAGGSRGTASGEPRVVAGGSRGTASGESSMVAGGSRGTAGVVVASGSRGTASGEGGVVAGINPVAVRHNRANIPKSRGRGCFLYASRTEKKTGSYVAICAQEYRPHMSTTPGSVRFGEVVPTDNVINARYCNNCPIM